MRKFVSFIKRFGDLIMSIIFMTFLIFMIVYAGVSTSASVWNIIELLVVLCFTPFLAGYIFRNWRVKEIKNSVMTTYIDEHISLMEEELDKYEKEDLVNYMKSFQRYNNNMIEMM
jgi:Ca2+/Na+ antiporter